MHDVHGTGADLDNLMAPYTGAVPGAGVLVAINDKPVVRRAYGLADREAQRVATPQTSYRLASITKQFTAAAILVLADNGRVGLDDAASRWLPSLPQAVGAATIRQLLTHTSGVLDYEDFVAAGSAQVRDDDVLRLLEAQDRAYFEPGTAYRYSNSGYALLALIVERAAGVGFATFLRDEIFRPLGMHNTTAGVPSIDDRAYGYSATATGWTRTDQSETSAVLGDGGVYSSIDDLAKWDAALYTDKRLQEAFVPRVDTDDSNVKYGYGWRITGDSVWHSGETIGFRNVIVRWPKQRLTVVILTNRNELEPYATAVEIYSSSLQRS